MVGEQAGRRIGLGLGQAEQLLPEFERCLQRAARLIIHHQPPQHREELRRVAKLRTQLPRPGVGAFRVWAGVPLNGPQRGAQRHLEVQLLLEACRRLRQRRQHSQALPQMCNRFPIRRALQRALPGPLPVGQGLGMQAGGGVVLC